MAADKLPKYGMGYAICMENWLDSGMMLLHSSRILSYIPMKMYGICSKSGETLEF